MAAVLTVLTVTAKVVTPNQIPLLHHASDRAAVRLSCALVVLHCLLANGGMLRKRLEEIDIAGLEGSKASTFRNLAFWKHCPAETCAKRNGAAPHVSNRQKRRDNVSGSVVTDDLASHRRSQALP